MRIKSMNLFKKNDFRAVWDGMTPTIFTMRLFFDPLAVPLTVLFSKVGWISANLVTFSAVIPGLIGAWCFATGRFVAGAGGYYLFFLLDCIDGKLARLRGTADPLGAFYDFSADRIVIGFMLLGMSFYFVQHDMIVDFVAVQSYLLLFFLKDVLDLKIKESGIASQASPDGSGASDGLFGRLKIHFKPGQLLSCFIIFIVGPLSGLYLLSTCLAVLCVVFSLGKNVLLPWLRHPRSRR